MNTPSDGNTTEGNLASSLALGAHIQRHGLAIGQRMHVKYGSLVSEEALYQGMLWPHGGTSTTPLPNDVLDSFRRNGTGVMLKINDTVHAFAWHDISELWPVGTRESEDSPITESTAVS